MGHYKTKTKFELWKNHSLNTTHVLKILKKILKKLSPVDLNTEYFDFLDETSCQNVQNVTRVLYAPGEKNIQIKHPVIGINVTGFQGINCNSYMEANTKKQCISICNYIMSLLY